MRSIRTTLSLVLAALTVAAFAAPVASAEEWTKEGKELGATMDPVFTDEGFPVKEGAGSVSAQGAFRFQSGYGGYECTLKANASLGVNSGIGWITEATIDPKTCKGLGGQAFCSITSASTSGLPWGLAAGTSTISTGATVSLKVTGGFCPSTEVTLSGAYLYTPDNAQAMSTWTPSGSVGTTIVNTKGETINTTSSVSGKLNLSPAGRYGIDKVAAVGLSGTLEWSGAMKGLICSVTANQVLSVGGDGLLKSFAGSCTPKGSFTCNVKSLSQEGPAWKILNEGTKVKAENVKFKVTFEAPCFHQYFLVEGTLYETPAGGEVNAISKTALSGTLTTVSDKENMGGTWTGFLNWSPAGVFGL